MTSTKRTILFLAIACMALLGLSGQARAVTTDDPTPVPPFISCTATASPSAPLQCTTNVDPAGRKITATNLLTHKTLNVANYTVIPAVSLGDGTWALSWTPSVVDSRLYTISVPYNCVRLGCLNAVSANFTVTAAAAPSPYLTNCHVIPFSNSALVVNCYTVVNNGGLNQVRADASCAGANIIHVYGPWVGPRVNSYAYCPPGYTIIAWTYQLR